MPEFAIGCIEIKALSLQRVLEMFQPLLHKNIDVIGGPAVTMQHHRDPPDHTAADVLLAQDARNESSGFHDGAALVEHRKSLGGQVNHTQILA